VVTWNRLTNGLAERYDMSHRSVVTCQDKMVTKRRYPILPDAILYFLESEKPHSCIIAHSFKLSTSVSSAVTIMDRVRNYTDARCLLDETFDPLGLFHSDEEDQGSRKLRRLVNSCSGPSLADVTGRIHVSMKTQ
jgi:hypothetical protein